MDVVAHYHAPETAKAASSPMHCYPEVTYQFTASCNKFSANSLPDDIPIVCKPKKQRVYHGDLVLQRLSREERRRRRRCTEKYRNAHATRERARIEAFNHGFGELRKLLHIYPPDKKLSKIEILRSAIAYIAFLKHILES